jgi:hypothetical protein
VNFPGSTDAKRTHSLRVGPAWCQDWLTPTASSEPTKGRKETKKKLTLQDVCIYIPPLWSSGQGSWLQIQRSGIDSQRYQNFWEVVGLKQGPLSLVSTTEELLEEKVAAPV